MMFSQCLLERPLHFAERLAVLAPQLIHVRRHFSPAHSGLLARFLNCLLQVRVLVPGGIALLRLSGHLPELPL